MRIFGLLGFELGFHLLYETDALFVALLQEDEL